MFAKFSAFRFQKGANLGPEAIRRFSSKKSLKNHNNLMKMTNVRGEPYGEPELTEENEMKPVA